MRNEKVAKVTDFDDPKLNIEWTILEKPMVGASEPLTPSLIHEKD